MIFVCDITTPLATPASSPLHSTLKITSGLIYKIEVEFPTGPSGLLYVSSYDGGHPLWPSNPGRWYHSDGGIIAFDDLYFKSQPPYQIDFYSYNLDTIHDHWCQWRIGLVSEEVFIARFLPSYEYKFFRKMLDDIAVEQRVQAQASLETPFSWLV